MSDLYLAIYREEGQEATVYTRDGQILVAGKDEWGAITNKSNLVKIDGRSVSDDLTAQFVDLLENLRN